MTPACHSPNPLNPVIAAFFWRSKADTLLKVDFVDKDNAQVNELAVANLEDAWVSTTGGGSFNGNDYVTSDDDRFRIRAILGTGHTTVRAFLSTKNEKYEFIINDAVTAIDLSEEPVGSGIYLSEPLALLPFISDDEDTNFTSATQPEDNSTNDRTHLAITGSEVRITKLEIGSSVIEPTAPLIAADVMSGNSMNVVIVNVQGKNSIGLLETPLDNDEIKLLKTEIRQFFSSLGIEPQFEVHTVSAEPGNIPGVSDGAFTDDIDVQVSLDASNKITLSAESVSLLNYLEANGKYDSNKLTLVYLTDFDNVNASEIAFAVYDEVASSQLLGPVIFLNSSSDDLDKWTAPHELLHLLLDGSHRDSPGSGFLQVLYNTRKFIEPDFKGLKRATLWGLGSSAGGINGPNRIFDNMGESVLDSRFIDHNNSQ